VRRNPTRHERSIAKRLNISDAQLLGLLEIKAGRRSANVGHHLFDKGLVTTDASPWHRYVLTAAGLALVERARAMGY
jgi:hypothetical protein